MSRKIRVCLTLTTLFSLALTSLAYGEDQYSTQINNEPTVTNGTKKEILLSFVGDIHFEGKVANAIKVGKNPFDDVKGVFKSSDLVIGNLETAITRSKEKSIKQYNFKSESGNLKIFNENNVSLLSIANNHTYDYLSKGFSDTLDALKKYNLNYVGGGENFNTAHKGVILPVAGKNLCFVAYARVNGGSIALNSLKKSGINDGYNNKQIANDIKRILATSNCFKLILLQHWGEENKAIPRQREIDGAKYFHSLGVDIVVGSHPHVLQPIELKNNKLTAYSLGNFLFYSTSLSNRTSTILQIHIDLNDGTITYNSLPILIDLKTGFPRLR